MDSAAGERSMAAPNMTAVAPKSAHPARLKLAVRGAVQGVGFRPFVYRLANELGLVGWVNNSPQGVLVEVEGQRAELEEFRLRLEAEPPPRSSIQSCEVSWLDAAGYDGFVIRASETHGGKSALVLPDLATCPDCLREIFDPTNRRHRYPFTNCTNCGPRFSLIDALPYDRATTSMRGFQMCSACQAEYDDPNDRRFHAQPNACPACGPQLELWSGDAGSGTGCLPVQRRARMESEPPAAMATSQDWGAAGSTTDRCLPSRLARGNDALLAAAHAIRCGQIVAVKGIGGFHLLVDARNDAAVRRLRERKQREEKPFALMFPSLESVREVCEVSPLEEGLLSSPEAPIVLLGWLNARPHPGPLPQEREKHSPHSGESEAGVCSNDNRIQVTLDSCPRSPGERVRVRANVEQTSARITPSVAPNNPNLGVMLPSNPLHHLLVAELGFPVVATSGNLCDEPICTDEHEALERLRGIADVFLVHNRPIVRHTDDSIVRVMLGREMVLRRARGYAPLPVSLNQQLSAINHQPILAVGAHLKNSVALAVGKQVFLSQHIGDLETEQANSAFRRVAADLPRLYDAQPEVIAADLHPDYLSTQFASELTGRVASPLPAVGAHGVTRPTLIRVQHHVAHVLSCMAENEVELPALGVAWDCTGLGTDGTIWGGEFFLVTDDRVERIAHLRPFRLPGGDAAVREPRRAAFGLLHEAAKGRDNLSLHMQQKVAHQFSPAELAAVETMLARGVNSPVCTSVGRLFDAVAALVGLRSRLRFEGQAAMELEFALEGINSEASYALPLAGHASPVQLDWGGMIASILGDLARGVSIGEISAKFHNTLAEAVVTVARRSGEQRVALSGGCFQNRYLLERTVKRLRAEGFLASWHQRVPTNDGGIALGQVVAARRAIANRKS